MSGVAVPQPGELCLAGLASSDPDRSVRFYGELLGWEARELAGAVMALGPPGDEVAVVYQQTPQARSAGVIPHWTPFVPVRSIDSALRAAVELGALALRDPFETAGAAWVAPIADPTGATVSLWDPGPADPGLASRPSAGDCWHELMTNDVPQARRFYADLFGWDTGAKENGAFLIRFGGIAVGAIREPGPCDIAAASWIPGFPVEDVDASVREAERLGGQRLQSCSDRLAVLRDPDRAAFGVFARPG